MVPFLARVFRQFHLVVGVTAPPPGVEEKKFVLIWLAVIGVVVVWSALVLYLMVYVF